VRAISSGTVADTQLFKTGLITSDLAVAMHHLAAALKVDWTPVQVAQLTLQRGEELEVVELAFAYSRSGPPYLELLQAQPQGYYASPPGTHLHHVGMWVDDLAAESRRLAALGFPLEAAGVREGRAPQIFAFHANPGGLRVELVDRVMEPSFLAWVAGGELQL
jgi:hypothetical protein